MGSLIPTLSSCHPLQLPPAEKDDRLNLNVRTGSASTLYNSFIFTYGGLTIALELSNYTVEEINRTFHNKVNETNLRFKTIDKYLSGELFYMNLIERHWTRVAFDNSLAPSRPSPRLLHQMCALNNCIYLFGGLVLPDFTNGDASFLSATNDLWEFNLEKNKWTLLHDGVDYSRDKAIPAPRYNHKMATISSLSFVNKRDHFGIFICGGRDQRGREIYDNVLFDLVEKRYVGTSPLQLSVTTSNPKKDEAHGLNNFKANEDHLLSLNSTTGMILSFVEEVESEQKIDGKTKTLHTSTTHEESLIVYSATKEDHHNSLVSFKLGKSIKSGRTLPVHRKKIVNNLTTPFNLRYPSGGLFGQNIVVTGFLPGEIDISIFIYNKPTGKWSRLNVVCNHDYGSHRFWGGFVWQSHHKVVLLGNYLTSRTTSSVRYFTIMVTVSLPITNILASSELEGGHFHREDGTKVYRRKSSTTTDNDEFSSDTSSSEGASDGNEEDDLLHTRRHSITTLATDKSPAAISFTEYVHYAAPKVTFTTIRSVFPPAAITLGRNAFERYGDMVSDFELVSSNGDRIPVCLVVLMERWGGYFVQLLSKGYVQAVDKFETQQAMGLYEGQRLRSKTSNSSESPSSSPRPPLKTNTSAVDPHQINFRRSSMTSSHFNTNPLFPSDLQDIPPQLPLPTESLPPVPATPVSFRSSSRKGSQDLGSPRASLLHTLTVLRNIPTSRSPRDSPFASPRASLSGQGGIAPGINHPVNSSAGELFGSPFSNFRSPGRTLSAAATNRRRSIDVLMAGEPAELTKPSDSLDLRTEKASLSTMNSEGTRDSSIAEGYKSSDDDSSRTGSQISSGSISAPTPFTPSDSKEGEIDKQEGDVFENALLNFDNIESNTFRMEPSLIPRKLYFPFPTITVKAFCEYLYTGQIGNKWILAPTVLDNLLIAKQYRVPLLYDLISEVLFGIIGRKEAYVVGEGNKLKRKYFDLMKQLGAPTDPNFSFPLDEYEGFMDTVDDAYLDIGLLKKISRTRKTRAASKSSKKSTSSLFAGMDEESLSKKRSSKELSPKEVVETDQELSPKSRGDENDNTLERNDEDSDGHDDTFEGAPENMENVVEKVTTNVEEEDEVNVSDEREMNSNSEEEQEIELGYLDTYANSGIPIGPRSKSVFDKHSFLFQELKQAEEEIEAEDEDERGRGASTSTKDTDYAERNANYALGELISPDAPIPSDYSIDLIFEAGTIVSDLKLMLRAYNLRAMTRILKRTRADIERAISELEELVESKKHHDDLKLKRATGTESVKYENRKSSGIDPHTVAHETSESPSETSAMIRSESSSFGFHDMVPSSSNNSVNTTNSQRSNGGGSTTGSAHPISRTGSHTSLRGLTSLTPFSKSKERLARNESASDLVSMDKVPMTFDKSIRKKFHTVGTGVLGRVPTTKAEEVITSSASSIKSAATAATSATTSVNKKYGLFHLHRREKTSSGDELSVESNKLERASSQVSLSSGSSKNESTTGTTHKRRGRGLFGLMK
ncbi:uncharacterized protein SPAPADRAFT_72544 [Spathaspora passalidarum NRRL Y-27907]|uniref:BTB domain-containing protein n=1 Tax=Spathaspora passalidarum (strain NRRL Y-27907 / 11-Y1) TaxID=619300 RepID=G3ARY3_SPAPN|nr:uncharacterized protein SPAPADRAFT_72544 [Spathaspora passalidarum NRRL Y-27907]EGW31832.1 hypothetical protein SPAPADRAFT_72544 [Spathaspora passalidarum NRRL Y-27907]